MAKGDHIDPSTTEVGARAFDASTGSVVWDRQLFQGSNCANPEVFYADATFHHDQLWTGYAVYGFTDTCTGFASPVGLDPDDGSTTSTGTAVFGSPAVHEPTADVVVQVQVPALGSTPTIVQTGAVSWTGTVPNWAPWDVAPTVRDGMVTTSGAGVVHSYSMYGCGADPCSPVWSTDVGERVVALLDAGTANGVFAAAGTNLVRIDRSTGQATSIPLGEFPRGLAFADGTLYVAAGTTLYAFSTAGSGSLLWTKTLSAAASTNPVVAGGVVYVGETSGAVEAFDTAGTLLHTLTVSGLVDHVTVANGRVFVVNFDHPGTTRLTAFGLP